MTTCPLADLLPYEGSQKIGEAVLREVARMVLDLSRDTGQSPQDILRESFTRATPDGDVPRLPLQWVLVLNDVWNSGEYAEYEKARREAER